MNSPQGFTEARALLAAVAAAYGLEVRHLTGARRTRTVCAARHEAMAQIRAETDLSYAEIGALFNRDTTTVVYAVKCRRACPEVPA